MKRITSLLLLLLIVLTFSSCVHKTLREASKGINPPVYTTLKETRYRLISEEREKAEKEAEEKRVAEENARLEAEERLSNHEYPENLDDLGYPHLYTPSKSASTLNEDKTFTVILLPLGDFTLDEKTLSYINQPVILFDAGIIDQNRWGNVLVML